MSAAFRRCPYPASKERPGVLSTNATACKEWERGRREEGEKTLRDDFPISPSPPLPISRSRIVNMPPTPTKLKLAPGNRLRITWSDDQVREYTFRELRDNCPC